MVRDRGWAAGVGQPESEAPPASHRGFQQTVPRVWTKGGSWRCELSADGQGACPGEAGRFPS